MIDEEYVKELLRRKSDVLFHREGQELEFKEQFSFAGLADYFRDFAAFANNRGGFKHVRENLIRAYPLSARELAAEIQKILPFVGHGEIWKAIGENGLKNNSDYSVYNFRNKMQEDDFISTGHMPSGAPNIYNHKAVDFLVNLFRNQHNR